MKAFGFNRNAAIHATSCLAGASARSGASTSIVGWPWPLTLWQSRQPSLATSALPRSTAPAGGAAAGDPALLGGVGAGAGGVASFGCGALACEAGELASAVDAETASSLPVSLRAPTTVSVPKAR